MTRRALLLLALVAAPLGARLQPCGECGAQLGLHGSPQLQLGLVEPQRALDHGDAAIVGQALFGNIQARHDLEPRDDRRVQVAHVRRHRHCLQ